MVMFFWKSKIVQTLNSFISKKWDKDILDLKILITRDHSSINYRPLNLLLRFSGSIISHPYIDKDINTSKAPIFNTYFSIKVPISKVIIKMYPYLKVWSFCVHWLYYCSPFNFLQNLSKIFFTDIFQLHKYQLLAFINVPTTCKW